MSVLSIISLMLFGAINMVDAATYTKPVSTNTTIYTAVYKTFETAKYYTSGETRWTFSGHGIGYVSGSSGKGVTASSPKTTSHSNSNGKQYITRCTTLTMVDYNYINHNANSYRKWAFDTTKNKFD